MANCIDFSKLTNVDSMCENSAHERKFLDSAYDEALSYVKSFTWTKNVVRAYLGFSALDILALFLFKFESKINDTDEWLWVLVGDLPPAYFVVDRACDARSALLVYCSLMDDWAKAVMHNRSLADVFPVRAPATIDNAKLLHLRTIFIRDKIIPLLEDSK